MADRPRRPRATGRPRRVRIWRAWLFVALACVLSLAVAGWTDATAQSRARHEQTTLVEADTLLASLRHEAAAEAATKASTTTKRDELDAYVATTLARLSTTNTALNSARVSAYLQGQNISILESCLGGIQNALADLRGGNNTAATHDISSVSSSCTQLDGGSSSGLVYPFNFPDPDILLVGSTYYAYATNSVGGNIAIIDSSDLQHWNAVGTALPALPSWANPDYTWAPSVAYIGGKYDLYYAVDPTGSTDECISVATATSPAGPFVDSSTAPLECQNALGGSIDPDVFVDTNGSVSLLWKSENAQIWSQPLDPSGTVFATGSTATAILNQDQPWEGGVIEAPDMVEFEGRYLLFYSGNDWSTASYGVGVASCNSPIGPCHDLAGVPILASSDGMVGPGGESVFSDAGGHFWMAFAAWVPTAVGGSNSRALYVRSLNLSGVPSVGSAP